MLSRFKIPPFDAVKTHLKETVGSTSRTTRLATVTAGAALAAVTAGVSATPAMAATAGSLSSTGSATLTAATKTANPGPGTAAPAARHPVPFALDTAMVAPLDQLAPPAHLPVAPIAKAAPDGPLSRVARPSTAAPQKLPAQPVARTGLANVSKNAAAPATPAQPTPPPAPPPAPKPYHFYDSVTPQMIPPGQQVATYATGGYAVPASQVAGRGNVLWIDTRGTDPAAQALDVEPGDATPGIAASWAFQKLHGAPGAVARIYTMISEWPAVKAAIATLPPPMQSRVHYWIADPTGYDHVVPGSDATQWFWGKSWDISTALPGF